MPAPLPTFAADCERCARALASSGAAALGDFFALTAARGVRYAQMLTRHREDAEDAYQAALVRLARAPHALLEARHPWAYFLAMVRHEALRIARRRMRWLLRQQSDVSWDADVPGVEQQETARLVREVLAELPRVQSEVVVLKLWEGMTFAEIADVLEISANTAASRYRYALLKLTSRLQPLAEEVGHV